jgi:cephalosporin-C deacetylase
MMNFGRRIKCPIYISVGLIDGTCPPNGIYAMYNLIPSKDKHIELHRDMGHYGRNLKGGAAISRAVQAAAKK